MNPIRDISGFCVYASGVCFLYFEQGYRGKVSSGHTYVPLIRGQKKKMREKRERERIRGEIMWNDDGKIKKCK